jgi:6,7-dimethyl-8-ribityllumazine synthase
MSDGLRVGVVVSTFNGTITEGLRRGALDELERLGVTEPTVVEVPGALELPVIARTLVDTGHDCVVALGAVIEGETDHYHHVATQAMAGLMQVSVASGRPVGIGLLTVRDIAHAVERSRPGGGTKGAEAARAAVEAARVVASLRAASPGPDD